MNLNWARVWAMMFVAGVATWAVGWHLISLVVALVASVPAALALRAAPPPERDDVPVRAFPE
jgi:hypothetical protein